MSHTPTLAVSAPRRRRPLRFHRSRARSPSPGRARCQRESPTGSPGTKRDPSGERGRVPALENQIFPESVASREGLRSFAAGAHAAVPRVTSVENRSHLFTGAHSIQSAPMDLPKTASAVGIGGGVGGCSIAYNLARRGQRDVVVVERETVGSGTTSKAAGGIRVQFATETEIRFSLEAIRVFERYQDEFGVDPGYKKIGYLFLV